MSVINTTALSLGEDHSDDSSESADYTIPTATQEEPDESTIAASSEVSLPVSSDGPPPSMLDGMTPRHHDYRYRVVVMGCHTGTRQSSFVMQRVLRKVDGAICVLQLWDCPSNALTFSLISREADAVVIFYRFTEQLERFRKTVSERAPLTARIIEVCINSTANVENAPFYFPMEDTAFFDRLNGDAEGITETFWQAVAAGPDYLRMADDHRISFDPNVDFVVSVSGQDRCRCSSKCSLM